MAIPAVFAALAATSCGSSGSTSTAPTPIVRCGLTLSSPNEAIPATGGTAAIQVTTTRECTWTVEVEGSWLSLRSAANGQGDGTVEFAAAPNHDPVNRRGALVLNTQRAEITQSAAECVITLAESSASYSPAGGSGQITVRASSSLCTWNATADQPWIVLRPPLEGRGAGTVSFDVDPTTGPPRTATITIAGQRFSILQSQGCSYEISPASASATSEGRNGTIMVATAPACPWTALSNVSWLSFTQGIGNGPGPLGFSVQPTSGPARTGTAVVAGKVFTVTQSAGCTYQVQPQNHSVAAGGGTANISVTTAVGCTWNASSDASWITVQAGASGNGSGGVVIAVAATTGPARTGALTVAGQRVTVSQGQGCSFTISPTQESVPSSGGGGRVTVTTADGCSWTAASNAQWIGITSGASGTGSGAVQYTAASTTGSARSGTMTIAGHTFTVNQGQGCSFTLAPTSANVPDAGGQTSFQVQTADGCGWTASTQTPWITIASGGTGSGNGTVQLTVGSNSGPSRAGSVSVADKTFTVTQGSGCSFSLSAPSQNVPAAGGNGSVNVSAPAGCGWTSTSNASWLSITDGATGTGNGAVTFTAAANTGGPRSGSLTIAGQTFTVNQADGCTAAIAPEQQPMPATGGSLNVAVTTPGGCTWTAQPNVPWITVASGSPGNGNGTVQLAIAANTGGPRTGTVTIAGRTLTIDQASGCTYTVAPTTLTVRAAENDERIDVTANNNCSWTATTATPWIQITRAVPGSGNGRVDITVAANSGPARSGTVTVAGQTVTVNQDSGCTYSINPTSATVPAGGGTGQATVTAGEGCTWTAVSQVPWITITTGASGSGSGTVIGTVEPNTTGAARMGTVTIAGLTFTVTQQQ